MSANFEAKKVVVEEIKEKIQGAKSVVLTHYERLTVAEVTDLRNRFRNAGCEYKVYKNTLVRKAFDELGVTDFAYVDAEGVKKLAAIPSREVLLAMLVGCLQSPIAKLAYALKAVADQKS